jgi:hypothetical protein
MAAMIPPRSLTTPHAAARKRFGVVLPVGLISIALAVLAARGVLAPLPLIVASVAVFSYVVLAAGRLLLRVAQASDLPLVAAWPLGIAATAVALPMLWANAAEMARPKFYWSRPFATHTVAPERLPAADFLRNRAQPGEAFAAWPLTSRHVGSDAPGVQGQHSMIK